MLTNDAINLETICVPPQELHATLRRVEHRQWWLWSSSMLVILLLLVAVASFAFPALLAQADDYYSFFMNQAVRSLVGMVLIFNVYTIYQQLQINRIRRQMTDQVFAVDKVEGLAQEAYRVAVLDSLTGLYNRRYIEQRLAEEITRSNRHGRPLTVILFDLDSFKQVNDRYGHAAGDAVLVAFADRLKRATRGSDASSRYGGDEFLAVLPECKIEEVQHVIKRVQGLMGQAGDARFPVLFSAGWADFIPGESAADLLNRADQALYAHKRGDPSPAASSTVRV